MNIAFVHKRYDNIGGTERDLYELAGAFARFGHEVHVYCGEMRVPPQEKIVCHRVPYFRLGETAKMLSFAFFGPKAAASAGHDVVISFSKVFRQDIARCGGGTHRGFLELIRPVREPRSKILRWPKDKAALFVEKTQFRTGNYKLVIAISNMVKRELMKFYDVPAEHIEVIYDGVDTSLYHPGNRKLHGPEIRKSFGIKPYQTLILFVGSGFLRKGLEFALQAMSSLKEEKLKLIVVGNDANLPYYKSMAQRLGIADSVFFAGLRRDVYRFYGGADFLVLPSVQEAFGNVILEALASGLPVITTEKAGASEILEGLLRNYILPRHDDTRAMARMMSELSDAGLRAELSVLARSTAEKYALEANARAVERLCERFAKKKPA